ncbi:hypothetical protein [Pseudomonas fluorescens]|uniref:hypothetical protein n=1 Tax=Pseudomonas fluorescens TaxID=294 RepID=UPI00123FBDB6|nr:hypothetical protein [Pseudomonas fluorescens]
MSKNFDKNQINGSDDITDLYHFKAKLKRRLNSTNRLDEILLKKLAQPADSLEPLGPLAGSRDATSRS